MTPLPAQVDRFRAVVERRLGLVFGPDRNDEMGVILGERARLAGAQDCARYLALVDAGDHEELRRLAERLTVGETYFFRNNEQFRALLDPVLPDRLRVLGRPVRILSAGCASGEEPYSIAILARRAGLAHAVAIEAFDVNPAAIARARAMRYSAWSLRETTAELREHAFRAEGTQFRLDDDLRGAVTFSERNLLDTNPKLWPRGAWDIVFCRNVLMYFPAAVMRAVLDRIAGSLAPGGYLFLGHAESLRGVSDMFHLRQAHGTFYYQRRDEPAARGTPASVPSPPPAPADDTWVEAIRLASARITQLVEGAPAERAPPVPPERPPIERAGPDVDGVHELMRQERYHDALARIVVMRNDAGGLRDPGAAHLCLLHAVLLTHAGDLPAAEALCHELLALDHRDAGVHYLLALCREHAGDLVGAIENDRASAWGDPVFAMPHLHLGMLARRAGDPDEACRELQIALVLLAREDARRILLFGGGFGREALERLCRAELRACGGAR
ncbi:MAG: protein-glutamate O-methyltransferase CheR [Myxococcota bacterium]